MPYAILGVVIAPILLFVLLRYDHGRDQDINEKENNPDERNKEENGTKSDKSSPKD